jgi:hypothetical protein
MINAEKRGVCGFDDLEADEFTEEEEFVDLMILQTYEFRQEEGLVGLMICRQADKFGEDEELVGLMICRLMNSQKKRSLWVS